MEEVIKLARQFRKEREWEQFHTPENIAKSISIEAGELLQHFQWDSLYDKQEVADELADILIYCIYMADSMEVDVKEIILSKMERNALKYPVDKAKGTSNKYTNL